MFNGVEEKAMNWGYTGILLFVLSVISFFFLHKKTIALILLVAGTFCLKTGVVQLDPFINWWDEQYHAVVAKNMVSDPFHPVLYNDPAVPYDYHNWTMNHTWVHKQPMFLWQMAAGMRIFGVNEFGLRFHMIVMAVILSLAIFRMGKILFSERTGFIASLFFSTNYYGIMLMSGHEHTDHNDFTFMFYVMMSCWSCLEYHRSGNWKFLILTGFFSGCAVLTKWLTGLLVFSGWGIAILADKNLRNNLKSYLHISLSLLVCIAVFLPWQLHIHYSFPVESKYESELAGKHFFEVIEGHDGAWDYHIQKLKDTFFKLNYVWYYILALMFYFVYSSKILFHKVTITGWILILFLFFSLAATKMPAFTYVIIPLLYLLLAFTLDKIIGVFEKNKKWIAHTLSVIFILFLSFKNLQTEKLFQNFSVKSDDAVYRIQRMNDLAAIKSLYESMDEKTLVFNCRPGEAMMVMFYTSYMAYEFYPNRQLFDELTQKGYKIALFNSSDMPAEVRNMPEIIIIMNSVWK